jgi:hypothetical protein
MLEHLAAACGEELVLDARPRGVPFEDARLAEQARLAIDRRLQLASSLESVCRRDQGQGIEGARAW